MKRRLSLPSILSLLTMLLLLGIIAMPAAGQEQQMTVNGVQPGVTSNQTEQVLTISGTGFIDGAVVTFDKLFKLPTTFVNGTTLRATIPAAIEPGTYAISVTNPDRVTATLPNAVTVFGPTAVQPDRVSNETETQLVVTGAGFSEGAAVILEGYGALATTFVSSSMLRVTLPAGVPAGVYSIRVVNPDAASSVLKDALTVTAPAATPGPTNTPEPTPTPQPTAFIRPLIVVQSYGASSTEITPGTNLAFEMTLANAGQATATNLVATFVSGDFIPRETGGVRAIGTLGPGQPSRFWQPLFSSRELSGKSTAVLEVQVSYTDQMGTAYTDTFSLTFSVVRVATGPGATPTPTPTPTLIPRLRPQLLVSTYETDKEPLEPGSRFTLHLEVENAGNTDAENITLIVGGGVEENGGTTNPEGTPEPGGGGGVSGAGGEFGNFAPVGSSNVSFLGNLAMGDRLEADVQLIVNATTKPAAYPVVVSFVYNDAKGERFVDEQVVTLLVYATPAVEINFYTQPAPLFVGQPGPLPLQVVNVGKNSAIFGNMSVTGTNAQFTNNNIFVGALEPGGFFPLDASVIPEQPGMLEIIVRLSYTDDFNQPQVITETLSVEVLEAPPMEEPPVDSGPEGGPGMPPPEQTNETWRQKAWRFVLGMVGLSSGPRETTPPIDGPGMPPVDGSGEGQGPVDGPGGAPPIDGPGVPIDGPGGGVAPVEESH